jgi:hypothetical protein
MRTFARHFGEPVIRVHELDGECRTVAVEPEFRAPTPADVKGAARRAVSFGSADRPVGADLGPPVSYLALGEGIPVYDRRGRRIGVVERIAADAALDIFDGLIIHTEPLPGRHVFAGVDQIAELHERGVLLALDARELSPLREPPSAEDERETARRREAPRAATPSV